jgi:hypothetical protein
LDGRPGLGIEVDEKAVAELTLAEYDAEGVSA